MMVVSGDPPEASCTGSNERLHPMAQDKSPSLGCSASRDSSNSGSEPLTYTPKPTPVQLSFGSDEPVRITVELLSYNPITKGVERELKSMAIDPIISRFPDLLDLIQVAFHIKGSVDVFYRADMPADFGRTTREVFLPLLSDWDLTIACQEHAQPDLFLRAQLARDSRNLQGASLGLSDVVLRFASQTQEPVPTLGQTLGLHVGRTFSRVMCVFSSVFKQPRITINDWRALFCPEGRLRRPIDMWSRVFFCGLEPALRREAWPFLLQVVPLDLSADERLRFYAMRTQTYCCLRQAWLSRNPKYVETLSNTIRKDVLRTDRQHPYFNVDDNHPNVISLFNILMTFSADGSRSSYYQGMSDIVAPILVVLDDEALSYWGFSARMAHMKYHFAASGKTIMSKFRHLAVMVRHLDPEFYNFLENIDGVHMFFSYRWLLLDMKREFAFDDALSVLEVIWASVPPKTDLVDRDMYFRRLLLAYYSQSFRQEKDTQPENLSVLDQQLYDETEGLLETPGSPFTLFVAASMILQMRDAVLQESPDYTAMCMLFDRLARRHDVQKILEKARVLFFSYLHGYFLRHYRHLESLENTNLKQRSAC